MKKPQIKYYFPTYGSHKNIKGWFSITGKLRLIKDPVYGSVPYTDLEGYILSSVTFNRLHYIHQNSLAYFVYPAARTSRFIHSIGVMHLASNIFKYSLLNAKEDDRGDFLKALKSEISKIVERIKENAEKGVYKGYGIKGEVISELQELVISKGLEAFGDILYQYRALKLFALLGLKKEEELVYYITLQALRIAALVHDIGHLSFSHISEYVLQGILDELKEEKEKNRGDEEKIKKIDDSDVYKILVKFHEASGKIHELIRLDILEFMLAEEIFNILSRDIKPISLILLQKELVSEILSLEDSDFTALKSLYQIIAGDLDADRLDFIKRDLKVSGLSEEAGDVDRIIKFFTLVRDDDQFYFLPSIRSLNNIEDILENRFALYRYIAFHHRVALYNHLLEKIVNILINKVKYSKINRDLIAGDDILQLVRVCGREEERMHMYIFSQIDDYWLLNLLRVKYFKLIRSINKEDKDMDEDKLLKFFLSEFFRQSKKLVSLWKRDYEFKIFFIREILSDSKFISELKKNIESLKTEEVPQTKKIIQEFDLFLKFQEEGNDDESYFHFISTLTLIADLRKSFRHFVKCIEEKMQEKIKEKRIICAPVLGEVQIGVENLRLWDSEEQRAKDFIKISQVHNYLLRRVANAVTFYLYFPSDLNISNGKTNLDEMRNQIKKELGEVVKDCILKWLSSLT